MEELKKASLLLLRKEDSVLLAMKKRGFGAGRWNGVGGKPEAGETIDKTAIRECQEEILVTPKVIQHMATLDFHFPEAKSDWDQQVMVYTCTDWSGEPTETEEMKPVWYKIHEIPYDKMWKDDEYWLPKVLEGYFVRAAFTFDDNDNVVKHNIEVSEADKTL